jgi:cytochrome c oxidase subunit 2
MGITRHSLALLLIGAGGVMLAGPALGRLLAAPTPPRPSPSTPLGVGPSTLLGASQEAPNRREFTIVAKDFQYSPSRIEASQDDLVKITVRSEDIAHSFTIDEYRIAKRVPAGGSTTFEFQADRPGTFAFYCALTGDPGHRMMRGQFVVRGK